MRDRINALLLMLWRHPLGEPRRALVLTLTEARAENFAGACLDTITYCAEDALERLADGKRVERANDNTPPCEGAFFCAWKLTKFLVFKFLFSFFFFKCQIFKFSNFQILFSCIFPFLFHFIFVEILNFTFLPRLVLSERAICQQATRDARFTRRRSARAAASCASPSPPQRPTTVYGRA